MTDNGRVRTVGPVIHNLADGILDAHTHLSGSESGENAGRILDCMDACGVHKAFIFAPELNFQARLLTDEHLDDIRTHNDYCADICSAVPVRLLGGQYLKVDGR